MAKKDTISNKESSHEELKDEHGDTDVTKLTAELEEMKEKNLRVLADFENYKKRIQKEREEMNLLGNSVVLGMLLEVMDDLNRGLEQMEGEAPVGLTMINDKIMNLLSEQNIEEVGVSVGDVFDPKVMEAVGTVSVPDENQDNKVIHVERKGYKVKDKDVMLRGCRVIVGKKP
ncbi:nucleotide exchange factor GrpE [Candidatus Dojkabacteria bacterium]|uniref:Protein GrpE n=1 Tax=Candidatus Dojkabacteria bacterium TaxID=2099670 RepID=A0A955RL74_9BACT|nr:nucleotide exchange factor GrpE [Candidatus Dojkabacteria bacterium]